MLTDEGAVKRLSELGHGTRLSIFRLLVKASPTGMSVGEVQSQLEIPGSTLSHHLNRLMSAGLIRQQREGRILHCHAVLDSLDELMAYLTAECCTL